MEFPGEARLRRLLSTVVLATAICSVLWLPNSIPPVSAQSEGGNAVLKSCFASISRADVGDTVRLSAKATNTWAYEKYLYVEFTFYDKHGDNVGSLESSGEMVRAGNSYTFSQTTEAGSRYLPQGGNSVVCDLYWIDSNSKHQVQDYTGENGKLPNATVTVTEPPTRMPTPTTLRPTPTTLRPTPTTLRPTPTTLRPTPTTLRPTPTTLRPTPTTLRPTPTTLRPTPTTLRATPTPVLGEPVVHLHAASEETKTGQPVAITLSVQNASSDPALFFSASLKAPSGLLLNGAPCPSQGLCSAASGLSVGEQTVMQLEATANRAGEYDLVATVNWRPGDGSDGSSLSRKLKLNITDPVEGETDVILHAPRTEVNVGESVTLTLAAANSIAKPPMTLKFVLRTPSGWTLSGAGFAEACAGQCIATYKLNTGVQRDISLQMVPNEAGAVSVKAGMEWYFGNDLESLVIKEETLELHAVAPTPTVMGPLSEVNLPEVNLGWILFLSGVAVVGFVGFLLVWMYRQSKKR